MKRFALWSACGLTSLALLTGTTFAQNRQGNNTTGGQRQTGTTTQRTQRQPGLVAPAGQRQTGTTTQGTQRTTTQRTQRTQRTGPQQTRTGGRLVVRPTTRTTRVVRTTRDDLGRFTNRHLRNILENGGGTPEARRAIRDVLAGKTLTPREAEALRRELRRGDLTGPQRDALALALRRNRLLRRELAGEGGAVVEGGAVEGGVVEGGVAQGTPVAGDSAVAQAQYGVKITKLLDGTASRQGLVLGDVIVSYNGVQTPDFDTLKEAVHDSSGEVEAVFVNSENGQMESIMLYPDDGRIGVGGEAVPLDE